jgi:hypothetical protein
MSKLQEIPLGFSMAVPLGILAGRDRDGPNGIFRCDAGLLGLENPNGIPHATPRLPEPRNIKGIPHATRTQTRFLEIPTKFPPTAFPHRPPAPRLKIPTGFHTKAQGCTSQAWRRRATLGYPSATHQPQQGCTPPRHIRIRCGTPSGSVDGALRPKVAPQS